TPLRAAVPQISINVDQAQAESLQVSVGDVYNTVQTYLGSSYVNLFNRFGRNYMVYAQADSPYRLTQANINDYYVRNNGGTMVPVGTMAGIKPAQGPSVITLYNLFPSATINGAANEAYSSGQALQVMDGIARKTLPPGMSYEWTAMSYQ